MSEILATDAKPRYLGLETALAELDQFAYNPGLSEMVGLYSEENLPSDLAGRLAMAKTIANSHWHFRKDMERQEVDWNSNLLNDLDSEQSHAVVAAADRLGMVDSGELRNETPDYLLVAGGANEAPVDRLRFAMGAVQGLGWLAYLGSSRPLPDNEKARTAYYAPGAATESDLGAAAFRYLLNANLANEDLEEINGEVSGTSHYRFGYQDDVKSAFVFSTPNNTEGKRANTGDTFRYFADRAGLAEQSDTAIAVVTTGLFAPKQHLAAVQELVLPYNTEVETIGHGAAYSGVIRTPAQYLQEARSTVTAAVRLHGAIERAQQVIS